MYNITTKQKADTSLDAKRNRKHANNRKNWKEKMTRLDISQEIEIRVNGRYAEMNSTTKIALK